jgi:Glycine-zipper domain
MVPAGSPVPIATSGYQQAGEASIKKAARGAAAGAAIGAIAGDAGKGAAIGATAGAMKKGETITIPAGTLLEFTITQPVNLQVGG